MQRLDGMPNIVREDFKQMARIPKITLIAVLLMVAFSASPTLGGDEQAVNVSCYVGSQEQYTAVGNLDVSNPSRNAVGLCNAIYRDCYSRCWSCWTDSDGYDVCRDVSGRQFSR